MPSDKPASEKQVQVDKQIEKPIEKPIEPPEKIGYRLDIRRKRTKMVSNQFSARMTKDPESLSLQLQVADGRFGMQRSTRNALNVSVEKSKTASRTHRVKLVERWGSDSKGKSPIMGNNSSIFRDQESRSRFIRGSRVAGLRNSAINFDNVTENRLLELSALSPIVNDSKHEVDKSTYRRQESNISPKRGECAWVIKASRETPRVKVLPIVGLSNPPESTRNVTSNRTTRILRLGADVNEGSPSIDKGVLREDDGRNKRVVMSIEDKIMEQRELFRQRSNLATREKSASKRQGEVMDKMVEQKGGFWLFNSQGADSVNKGGVRPASRAWEDYGSRSSGKKDITEEIKKSLEIAASEKEVREESYRSKEKIEEKHYGYGLSVSPAKNIEEQTIMTAATQQHVIEENMSVALKKLKSLENHTGLTMWQRHKANLTKLVLFDPLASASYANSRGKTSSPVKQAEGQTVVKSIKKRKEKGPILSISTMKLRVDRNEFGTK